MNEKPENPPAFPQTIDDMGTLTVRTQGMTLRDYFAAKAMQASISRDPEHMLGGYRDYQTLAREAYKAADAMLRAR